MARRTNRTPKKREAFLSVLAGGGSVTLASATAGIGRQRVYEWRQDDSDFATEWDVAVEAGTDVLEDEARRRAVEGVEEPVFFQGNTVGHVRRYSDTLLIFLLKGRRPKKFKDRVAHGGDETGPPIKHGVSALEIIESRLAGIRSRSGRGEDPGKPDGEPT